MSRNPYQSPTTRDIAAADSRSLTVSVPESAVLCYLVALLFSLLFPSFRDSPRIDEWFGAFSYPIRMTFFYATCALTLSISLMIPLAACLVIPFILSRRRFVCFGWGTPRFVGAGVYTALVVLVLAGVFLLLRLLLQYED
ncbi:hypothetical protein [Aporhodopirellula aestuarii]|uniref:Transmembrane protein n=1 Tax=Aporhodopirellula aestuarii TaxID=2950107 RepID=A0ABT0U9M8_9BACT|nr:hypothetical protein [Aporhodopirellula aestuarii]MCM2373593.1 hypothetical protein [Aporhodopirellula aestuarii]